LLLGLILLLRPVLRARRRADGKQRQQRRATKGTRTTSACTTCSIHVN